MQTVRLRELKDFIESIKDFKCIPDLENWVDGLDIGYTLKLIESKVKPMIPNVNELKMALYELRTCERLERIFSVDEDLHRIDLSEKSRKVCIDLLLQEIEKWNR